uniref:(northern house mosquito) hypothetical protein n=1 Tax=Culex pipiens TaxID=7175 RepID=A0A8D8KW68_CULPI
MNLRQCWSNPHPPRTYFKDPGIPEKDIRSGRKQKLRRVIPIDQHSLREPRQELLPQRRTALQHIPPTPADRTHPQQIRFRQVPKHALPNLRRQRRQLRFHLRPLARLVLLTSILLAPHQTPHVVQIFVHRFDHLRGQHPDRAQLGQFLVAVPLRQHASLRMTPAPLTEPKQPQVAAPGQRIQHRSREVRTLGMDDSAAAGGATARDARSAPGRRTQRVGHR